mgnify:FL=1|tara:strand:- start:133 stop:477 length:345 start_codon:yes stop_codon:yes gene_type:complete
MSQTNCTWEASLRCDEALSDDDMADEEASPRTHVDAKPPLARPRCVHFGASQYHPCPARSGSPDWEWECEECETSESEPDSDDELRTRLYEAGVNAGYNQLRRHEPSRAEILQR